MEGTVHNCLKPLRVEANLTQQELADTAGVSRQTIISMEKGNYVPSVLLALKLAKALNRTVEEIFAC